MRIFEVIYELGRMLFNKYFFLLVKCIYSFDFYVQHKKVPTVIYIESEGNPTEIVFKM